MRARRVLIAGTDRDVSLSAGFNHHFPKPVDYARLHALFCEGLTGPAHKNVTNGIWIASGRADTPKAPMTYRGALMNQQRGNLSSGERTASALLGIGLTVLAARRGGRILRTLTALAGTSLISRAVAGHCAMKAAVTGESTFREGMAEQWRRTSDTGRRFAQRAAESTRGGADPTGLRAAADGSHAAEVAAEMASDGADARPSGQRV
jgi:hypothetical protein